MKTLDGPLREAEVELIELHKAARNTPAWSDAQRRQFDENRMKKLDEAGDKLAAALRRAKEQCAAAERLLAH